MLYIYIGIYIVSRAEIGDEQCSTVEIILVLMEHVYRSHVCIGCLAFGDTVVASLSSVL